MVPTQNTPTKTVVSRALEKYDSDDVRYLVPFSQEGRLGCIVSLRRNSNTYVDEILSHRNLLILDATTKSGDSDDESSQSDSSEQYLDEDSLDERERRHAFRRAARRVFTTMLSAVTKFLSGFRRPQKEIDIYDFESQKHHITLPERAKGLYNFADKLRRDMIKLVYWNSKDKAKANKKSPENRIHPSLPKNSAMVLR